MNREICIYDDGYNTSNLTVSYNGKHKSPPLSPRESFNLPASPPHPSCNAVIMKTSFVLLFGTFTSTGPPTCELANAVMPVAPTPLPSPEPGLILREVTIGRGVQVCRRLHPSLYLPHALTLCPDRTTPAPSPLQTTPPSPSAPSPPSTTPPVLPPTTQTSCLHFPRLNSNFLSRHARLRPSCPPISNSPAITTSMQTIALFSTSMHRLTAHNRSVMSWPIRPQAPLHLLMRPRGRMEWVTARSTGYI
jgi:hypothetical protein